MSAWGKGHKIIMHVDMDMFFAAVELRDNPQLKDKPVVVGGPSETRGVVSCASYAARKYGIRAGMPTYQASRLCKNLIFITPNFDKYIQASSAVENILKRFSPFVEMCSIDEAVLDLTGCVRLWGSPEEMIKLVRDSIRNEVRLTCSVG
ncbi:MAG: DNA polymerase IV, partial [bacterium]|nr:DNA polymerase IV [bacterium]